jgi:hypothetical protein
MSMSYSTIRILEKILKVNFPNKKVFDNHELKIIFEEYVNNREKYEEAGSVNTNANKGHKIFRAFVEYCFYRNIANYDSMVLLTSDKGTGKSSFAIMMAREWCKIIGIKFDPERHIAYSNQQVQDKIQTLNYFEPLICDEAIRFACVTGDTKIQMPLDRKKYPEGIPIKELEGKKDFYVYSMNNKTRKIELKKAYGCRKTKTDVVYEVEFSNGNKIKCTKEHKFLTDAGEMKELREFFEEVEWFKGKSRRMKNGKMLFRTRFRNFTTKTDGFFKIKGKNWEDVYFETNSKGGKNSSPPYIKSIIELGKEDVYDILGVEGNNNYIANDLVVQNSSEDWGKTQNKELKKKLGQVRTKHLFYILCFPLKIMKLDKVYLESYVNYWIDLFGRGLGALYVKDKNPYHDSWRLKEFQKIGSYTEFTSVDKVKGALAKHPNFWYIIKGPKPTEKIYNNYLRTREHNVYDDANVLSTINKADVVRAMLIMTLKDILVRDSSLSIKRLLLHLQNEFHVDVNRQLFDGVMTDAAQLCEKVKEENLAKYL